MKNFKMIFLMLFLIGVTESCKKDTPVVEEIQQEVQIDKATQVSNALAKLDYNERNFFKFDYLSSNNANIVEGEELITEDVDLIKDVLGEVVLQNDASPFIKDVISQNGYAAWDRAKILNSSDNPGYYMINIPFAKIDETRTNAYLSVSKSPDNTFSFSFYNITDVESYVSSVLPENAESSFAFQVSLFINFDSDMFNNPNQDFANWLLIYNEHNIDKPLDEVFTRCVHLIYTNCACTPVYAFQGQTNSLQTNVCGPNQIYLCVTTINAVNCDDGNDQSWPPSNDGGGIPTDSGSSTGGSSGDGISSETPSQFLQNLQILCDGIDDPNDGGLNQISEETKKLCSILSSLIGNLTPTQIQNIFTKSENTQIAQYLLQNGDDSDFEMIDLFFDLTENGPIELSFKNFHMVHSSIVDIFDTLDDEIPHSRAEWIFLIQNAAFLPALATHSAQASIQAQNLFVNICGAPASTGGHNNGPIDAMRHAILTGLNARNISPQFADTFGDLHEDFPANPPNERTMDLHNNDFGLNLFNSNNSITELQIAINVGIGFTNGELRIIANDTVVTSSCN